jgi:hypothetical protein
VVDGSTPAERVSIALTQAGVGPSVLRAGGDLVVQGGPMFHPVCSGQCPSITVGGVNQFDASDFIFVTVVADDGKDGAGGWQQAVATLKFVRWTTTILPERWTCPRTVSTSASGAAGAAAFSRSSSQRTTRADGCSPRWEARSHPATTRTTRMPSRIRFRLASRPTRADIPGRNLEAG